MNLPLSLKHIYIFLILGISLSSAGPVSWHGMLTTSGNRIKNEGGTHNVQLKGPSLYWSSNAGSRFYNEEVVNWFVETMDISVIRAAMAVRYWDNGCSDPLAKESSNDFGYLSNTQKFPLATSKAEQEAIIDRVVQAAILNDIYVIIDWHTHCKAEASDAATFFEKMANKYMDKPNVIFEIFNEPTASDNWNQVLSYANTVIQRIRNTGSRHLILVGSPWWDSNPHECAQSSLKSTANFAPIACTLHFYAASHVYNSNLSQLQNANNALSNNAPVFVSEWGSVTSNGGTGGEAPNAQSTTSWLNWMDNNMVSSCQWNVSNLGETSAIWEAAKYTQYGMSLAALSTSGKILHKYMGGDTAANNFTVGKTFPPTANHPYGRSVTVVQEKDKSKTWTLADLGATNGEALDNVESPASINGNAITYTPNTVGSTSFNYTLSKGVNKSKHRITVKTVSAADEVNVSYKADTELTPAKLGIVWSENKTLAFTAQSVSPGTITRASNNRSLTYKPASNASKGGQATLTYTVGEGSYSLTKSVKLVLDNMPPNGGNITIAIKNDAPYSFSLDGTSGGANRLLTGSDPEGDPITIDKFQQMEGDPGTVSINFSKRTLTYTPAPGKKSGGKPIIYYWLTDGENVGEPGKITLTITGTGTDIGDINDTPIRVPQIAGANLRIKMLGKNLSVELAKSAVTRLDVYSLTGAKVATLMSGYQNAGSYEFSLNNFAKGVYIVRLKQGSTQTLRIVR